MKKKTRKPPKTAIALHYDGRNAPRVTAKGHGEVADAIIDRAREFGVPLHEDRELARLLSRIDLGDEIPYELYVAVAEVIAFAYIITGRFPADREDSETQ